MIWRLINAVSALQTAIVTFTSECMSLYRPGYFLGLPRGFLAGGALSSAAPGAAF